MAKFLPTEEVILEFRKGTRLIPEQLLQLIPGRSLARVGLGCRPLNGLRHVKIGQSRRDSVLKPKVARHELPLRLSHKNIAARVSSFFRFGNSV